jgi:hypothetical protein
MKRRDAVILVCGFVFLVSVVAAILVPLLVLLISQPSTYPSGIVTRKHLFLPQDSVRSARDPNLYFIEKPGGMIEGVLRVRTLNPNNASSGDGGGSISDSCCGHIVPSARLVEGMDYDIDVWAFSPLSPSFVDETWRKAMEIVDSAVGRRLFGFRRHAEFLGLELNGRNQVGAGHIDFGSDGILAVTLDWFVCSTPGTPMASCPPENRQLVEWKQFYNTVIFSWGDALLQFVYDLLSVFVHEIFHVCNADDLSVPGCEDSTMWFSTSKGETKKRTVDSATVNCMRDLYSEGGGGWDGGDRPRRGTGCPGGGSWWLG